MWCLPEIAHSNSDCFCPSSLSSAMISLTINSVSERAKNSDNFYPWCSLSFASISQTLSACLMQPVILYVLFRWILGQIMMMQCLLHSFSIKSKTRWTFRQSTGSVNIAVFSYLILSVIFICLVYSQAYWRHLF